MTKKTMTKKNNDQKKKELSEENLLVVGYCYQHLPKSGPSDYANWKAVNKWRYSTKYKKT